MLEFEMQLNPPKSYRKEPNKIVRLRRNTNQRDDITLVVAKHGSHTYESNEDPNYPDLKITRVDCIAQIAMDIRIV